MIIIIIITIILLLIIILIIIIIIIIIIKIIAWSVLQMTSLPVKSDHWGEKQNKVEHLTHNKYLQILNPVLEQSA